MNNELELSEENMSHMIFDFLYRKDETYNYEEVHLEEFFFVLNCNGLSGKAVRRKYTRFYPYIFMAHTSQILKEHLVMPYFMFSTYCVCIQVTKYLNILHLKKLFGSSSYIAVRYRKCSCT